MNWLITGLFSLVIWLVKDIVVIAISVRGTDPADRPEILQALYDNPVLVSRPVVKLWRRLTK